MSIQDLEVPNDYNIFVGSINGLSGGFPGPTGATGPAGPSGGSFTNNFTAQYGYSAITPNFGTGSINVPFNTMGYNPSGTWSLANGNTTSAQFNYTGPSGYFLVVVDFAYQYFGSSGGQYMSMIIITTGGQQGTGTSSQPITTNVLTTVSNNAIIPVNNGESLWISVLGNGAAAGDFVAQPGLGGGNISVIRIA